jgi:hypothetical protein
VLDWLRKLFSSAKAPEVEYRAPDTHGPPVPVSGPNAGLPPPVVPVEKPVPEEPGRQP